VFKRAGRKFYEAQWRDPITGKKKTRSTKKAKKRDAERIAAVIEAEIRDGRFKNRTVVPWSEFRERYETEKLRALADKTAKMYATVFNAVERIIDPKKLQSLDSGQISRFQAKLRGEGCSESTIKSYLRHLKSALRWAKRQGILAEVPEFEMPKRTKGMKGRGIATEEFERMLEKVPTIVGHEIANSWNHLLTGLWWSGLRLGEALDLNWTDDRLLCVDLSGRRPMFRIQAEGQKSNKYELLPMAPEFSEFLDRTPEQDRHGYVFNPEPRRAGNGRLRLDTTSSIICEFGRDACIKVAEKNGKVKYASAHDLRRAFGCRWALRVMPPILKQLMRHASIQTTMEYYVGQNAEQAADVLWDAVALETNVDGPAQPAMRQT
jgi:integrase